MSNIPLPRLIELTQNKGLLVVEQIYPQLFKEHLLKEQKRIHEGAKSVFIRLLVLGAVKTGKDMIYIP